MGKVERFVVRVNCGMWEPHSKIEMQQPNLRRTYDIFAYGICDYDIFAYGICDYDIFAYGICDYDIYAYFRKCTQYLKISCGLGCWSQVQKCATIICFIVLKSTIIYDTHTSAEVLYVNALKFSVDILQENC